MVAKRENFFEFPLDISCGKDVIFRPHRLGSKPRLEQPAGGGAGQIAADERIHVIHGKRLLRQKDFAASLLRYVFQDCEIADKARFVHHIARGLH
ncbi:hypothetical protein SDC9_141180 [bioreactor metagenome]|uniref:Uncharacterized protein n=1 Tax=bioreactor metagenome TaxID=1076179 RepID=A0A645DY27_9ZZZZ